MSSSRRKARELSVAAVYAHEMSENPVDLVIEESILCDDSDRSVKDFAVELTRQTVTHRNELDVFIKSRAHNWDFERIAVLDRIIMRVAVCEFFHFPDIPPKVSIDEAIEIAKRFSTEKSSQFINGILDGILEEKEDEIFVGKSSRGLSDGADLRE